MKKPALIDDWKRAHKFLTVQLSALIGALCELWQYLPYFKEYCPPQWVSAAFLVIIVARMIKQKPAEKMDQ